MRLKRSRRKNQGQQDVEVSDSTLSNNQSIARLAVLLLGCVLFVMASCGYRYYLNDVGAIIEQTLKNPKQGDNEEDTNGEEEETPLDGRTTIETIPHNLYTPNTTIISLSLPSTHQPVLPRYFDCAGHPPSNFGRYWTNLDRESNFRRPIGQCMKSNIQTRKPIMKNCGNYNIWQDLDWYEPPSPRAINATGVCFEPVLYPGALEAMYKAMPNATIINMIQQPREWFRRLPYDIHERWSTWCNPSHGGRFPTEHNLGHYKSFYNRYHQVLRDFVARHAGWQLIEIDLTKPATVIGDQLETKLRIDPLCWVDSTEGNIPLYKQKMPSGVQAITERLPRPNDITFPILVATMEKSGTTTATDYFNCAMGMNTASHQWTMRQHNGDHMNIGKCFEANVLDKRPPLENCGHWRVFAQINLFNADKNDPECYFPALEGGLEAFGQAYPYGTVLLQIRNASTWYSSMKRWSALDRRFATSPGCRQKGLTPHPKATEAMWVDFYETYTKRVRQTMELYPNLNYVEVPLSDKIGPTMDNIFGFSQETNCWKHKNSNPKVEKQH